MSNKQENYRIAYQKKNQKKPPKTKKTEQQQQQQRRDQPEDPESLWPSSTPLTVISFVCR